MTARRAGNAALAVTVALGVLLSASALDARNRRRARDARDLSVLYILPTPDLALGGSSRHVRYLSHSEPRAFATDDVGAVDVEPTTLFVGAPDAAFR